MSKQTLILIIILSLSTIGLLALALNKTTYSPKRVLLRPILPTPTINPYSPDTSLLFGDLQVFLASKSAIPASGSLTARKTAREYLLPIIINSGTNKVTTVQLGLAFDPNILTDLKINPSNFFENPVIFINQIDSKNGRISYVLGLVPSASESGKTPAWRGKQGVGTLATLTFQTTAAFDAAKTPIPQKQTSIIFLPKTFVKAEGLEESALKSTNSAELKFGN